MLKLYVLKLEKSSPIDSKDWKRTYHFGKPHVHISDKNHINICFSCVHCYRGHKNLYCEVLSLFFVENSSHCWLHRKRKSRHTPLVCIRIDISRFVRSGLWRRNGAVSFLVSVPSCEQRESPNVFGETIGIVFLVQVRVLNTERFESFLDFSPSLEQASSESRESEPIRKMPGRYSTAALLRTYTI